jgi:hypothetical protein
MRLFVNKRGPLMVAEWLRYCATNRKVAGSIQDAAIGIFHWHNPSDRTMALGSTQPLTEMSGTVSISDISVTIEIKLALILGGLV